MLSSTPPTLGTSVFGFTSLKTRYIPKGAIAAYNVSPWKNYEIVELLESLNITDNGATIYGLAEDATKDIVTYTRNFTHRGWQALYVPFDIPYDAISDKFDVAELNNFHQYDDNNDGDFDRTELEVLRLRAGSTIEHHTPYVIRAKETGEQTVAVSETKLTERQQKILNLIKESPTISGKQMSETLSVSQRTIERDLSALQKNGALKREGKDNDGMWVIVKNNAN